MPISDRGRFAGLAGVLLLAGCATSHPVPISGAEIRAALTDHTAMLPGGFSEYYAPDGVLYGWSDGEPYKGKWEVKDDSFCTALSDDPPVCSPVAREGDALYWSLDGEKKIARVDRIVPGNPRNLK
jgi:hypothetical protein